MNRWRQTQRKVSGHRERYLSSVPPVSVFQYEDTERFQDSDILTGKAHTLDYTNKFQENLQFQVMGHAGKITLNRDK